MTELTVGTAAVWISRPDSVRKNSSDYLIYSITTYNLYVELYIWYYCNATLDQNIAQHFFKTPTHKNKTASCVDSLHCCTARPVRGHTKTARAVLSQAQTNPDPTSQRNNNHHSGNKQTSAAVATTMILLSLIISRTTATWCNKHHRESYTKKFAAHRMAETIAGRQQKTSTPSLSSIKTARP